MLRPYFSSLNNFLDEFGAANQIYSGHFNEHNNHSECLRSMPGELGDIVYENSPPSCSKYHYDEIPGCTSTNFDEPATIGQMFNNPLFKGDRQSFQETQKNNSHQEMHSKNNGIVSGLNIKLMPNATILNSMLSLYIYIYIPISIRCYNHTDLLGFKPYSKN